MPNVFAYRVDHDRGLAPNPFLDRCSLAVCKPNVRAKAQLGDYVIGTSSYNKRKMRRSGIAGGLAVFIMRVTGEIGFDRYHRNYPNRRPNMRGSRMRRAGDAIYYRDPVTGEWMQSDSLHSRPGGGVSVGDLERDTGVDRILLSDDFTYWGKLAPTLPADLQMFNRKEVRSQRHFAEQEKAAFIAWAQPRLGHGRVGEPIDWHR